MDFTAQTKPTLKEWQSVERPVSDSERVVLQLILDGYSDHNIHRNNTLTLSQLSKLTEADIPCIHDYFFTAYFQETIAAIKVGSGGGDAYKTLYTKWTKACPVSEKLKKLNSASKIRLANLGKMLTPEKREDLFDFILTDFATKMLVPNKKDPNGSTFYLFTLIRLRSIAIPTLNTFVASWIDQVVIPYGSQKTDVPRVFNQAYTLIEKNPHLLKYNDLTLFSHQKELFRMFPPPNDTETGSPRIPKMVLYIAPTGTGKTLSPIGLSQGYRILFVCVARHVGLALAKSAISVGKRVAFAFGCDTASDIRLHNFAAVSYIVNTKSGGIYKVDNSDGQNVEIMICDIQSYLIAMHYMLAFNPDPSKLILYWDEPTITMDCESHPLHETIHKNWAENRIPNIVLSCATLPKEHEIQDTIADFRTKFFTDDGEPGQVRTIQSHDCRKSISLLDKRCMTKLPHLMFENYTELAQCVAHCRSNKTLLRYFDLAEIVRFAEYLNSVDMCRVKITDYFPTIASITMDSVKEYYLDLLQRVESRYWHVIYNYMTSTQKPKLRVLSAATTTASSDVRKVQSEQIVSTSNSVMAGGQIQRLSSIAIAPTTATSSKTQQPAPTTQGALLTTSDAHTLTDGPTIYLVEDVEKLGEFYMKASNISGRVLDGIRQNIQINEQIQEKISKLERDLEDKLGDELERDKKMEKEIFSSAVRQIKKQMDDLRAQVKPMAMEAIYVPNMKQHQLYWIHEFVENAFVPKVDEEVSKEVMMIEGIPEYMKVLLLMGVGIFARDPNSRYIELVKEMANKQALFMIIAQSDYIYGTNYQFCHGFVGKDLTKMTPQKTIQAMGRIGRSTIQQEYTVRFRDDRLVLELFNPTSDHCNLEAVNMCRLFIS
jgi:hypothetical protein